jgi:hypothetical protein
LPGRKKNGSASGCAAFVDAFLNCFLIERFAVAGRAVFPDIDYHVVSALFCRLSGYARLK